MDLICIVRGKYTFRKTVSEILILRTYQVALDENSAPLFCEMHTKQSWRLQSHASSLFLSQGAEPTFFLAQQFHPFIHTAAHYTMDKFKYFHQIQSNNFHTWGGGGYEE